MVSQRTDEIEVVQISHGDLIKLHASRAAKALGLPTEQFLAGWYDGKLDELTEESDHPDVVRWHMLMSFGRRQPR